MSAPLLRVTGLRVEFPLARGVLRAVDGASFVCNVLKTRCPVSDDWIAIVAVSPPR